MYRIVTQVSGYVSYREVHANTHPYQALIGSLLNFTLFSGNSWAHFFWIWLSFQLREEDSHSRHLFTVKKQNKDPTDCFSCRPLSLLNSDLKIFAKLPAHCLQSATSKFIWNRKQLRLKLSILQRRREDGGVTVPNFELYSWLFVLRPLLSWFDSHSSVSWRMLESNIVQPCTLQDVLFSNISKKQCQLRHDPII